MGRDAGADRHQIGNTPNPKPPPPAGRKSPPWMAQGGQGGAAAGVDLLLSTAFRAFETAANANHIACLDPQDGQARIHPELAAGVHVCDRSSCARENSGSALKATAQRAKIRLREKKRRGGAVMRREPQGRDRPEALIITPHQPLHFP